MKRHLAIFLLLTGLGFAIPGISFAQDIGDDADKLLLYACTVGTNTVCNQSGLFHDAIAEPFSQSTSVVIGTVIQKENIGEKSIAYSISVDFYLKNYQSFDLLTVTLNDAPQEAEAYPEVWYYNSPVFNEGDLIFAYLEKNDGSYKLLPESFALDKQERNRGPPPNIHLTRSPSEETFLQGEKILVSGDVRKMELVKAAKNGEQLDVELTLHKPYDENEVFFSDLIGIDVGGHYNYHLDTLNIPPGEYYLKVKYGPSSSSTDITIDFNSKYWSPLKQFNSGVPSDEIQCRGSLTLIIKNDGSPACVKEQTFLKLVERGLIITSKAERDLMLDAGYKLYPGVGWVQGVSQKTISAESESTISLPELQVDVTGQQQVRRGTTHDITVDVFRDANPVPDALVRITIEDYGEDIIRDFKGRTDDSGRFMFSWEIPKSFDDVKTLLAYVDVTDDISAKTVLFKFQVYCLPGETGCKVEGK